MVSKLLLATQENYFFAKKQNLADQQLIQDLGNYYYKIRNGLSASKSPQEYGAFPFDPYSHTPSHSGAQQPGMTGQVKEEILTRFGELGCFVDKGCITFDPSLLLKEEFLTQKKTFTYFDVSTTRRDLDVNENQLAFTFCQIPIIYSLFENDNYINILFSDNTNAEIHGNLIDADKSSSIFNRDGIVKQVEFYVNEKFLFNNIN